MRVILARHGRTNYNDLRLCNDDPGIDVHLTEVGIVQAERLAERLRLVEIDQIYVSRLKRTEQTAAIINRLHFAPITVDSRLDDNRTGYEGKPAPEYYAALSAATDKWSVRFNGGESLVDVKQRVGGFLLDLRAKPHKQVLIVTSMVIAQALYGLVEGLSNEEAADMLFETGSSIDFEI